MTVVPMTACTIAGVFAKFRHKQRSWCNPLESLRATRRTGHIPPPGAHSAAANADLVARAYVPDEALDVRGLYTCKACKP
jgi:hypothetical protein